MLGQLQKSGITYYENSSIITLIRNDKTIANAKKNNNLFTFNLAKSDPIMSAINKIIIIISQVQPTQLISKIKYICLWH